MLGRFSRAAPGAPSAQRGVVTRGVGVLERGEPRGEPRPQEPSAERWKEGLGPQPLGESGKKGSGVEEAVERSSSLSPAATRSHSAAEP